MSWRTFYFSIWIFISSTGMILLSLRQLRFAKNLKLLKNIPVAAHRMEWPKVSIIIPACDEAATIGPALRSLLAMDYPALEIVVVNDRSTDTTSSVLAEIAYHQPALKVVTVLELPKNWLGKVHAQYKAMEHATGDWILFTDADVHYKKNSLKKAITYCEDQSLDFLTLIPHIHAKSVGLKVCIAQFLTAGSQGIDIQKMQDPKNKSAVGCGAFNFVRASTYKASRGLEWLKMEVVDDGSFALMIKSMGTRCDLLSGLDEVELVWYSSVKEYVKGLEKNAFSIFQYMPSAVIVFTALVLFWFFGLYLAPFFYCSWPLFGMLLGAHFFYQYSNYKVLKQTSHFPIFVIVSLPLSLLISLFAVWRSMVLCLARGGIYWRKTFYSRQDLKTNQRLKPIDYFIFNKEL